MDGLKSETPIYHDDDDNNKNNKKEKFAKSKDNSKKDGRECHEPGADRNGRAHGHVASVEMIPLTILNVVLNSIKKRTETAT